MFIRFFCFQIFIEYILGRPAIWLFWYSRKFNSGGGSIGGGCSGVFDCWAGRWLYNTLRVDCGWVVSAGDCVVCTAEIGAHWDLEFGFMEERWKGTDCLCVWFEDALLTVGIFWWIFPAFVELCVLLIALKDGEFSLWNKKNVQHVDMLPCVNWKIWDREFDSKS